MGCAGDELVDLISVLKAKQIDARAKSASSIGAKKEVNPSPSLETFL